MLLGVASRRGAVASVSAYRSLQTLSARSASAPLRNALTPRLVPVFPRFASTAAREVEPETEEVEERNGESIKAAGEGAKPEAKQDVKLIPFDTLRGYINDDTLKALTFKPFTLSAMSEVQRRVLRLMPYLSGGTVESVARQRELDGVPLQYTAVENEELKARGRQDLLVKAKTGTGKTIVSTAMIPSPFKPANARLSSSLPLRRESTSSTN